MKIKLLLLLFTLVLVIVTGCGVSSADKFYLDNKLYGQKEFIEVNDVDLNKLIDDKHSFLVFTYNSYCSLEVPCDQIFDKFMKEYNIAIYSIPFEDFKSSYLYNKVSFAPSVIVIKNGVIVDYLDANSDDDLDCYQDVKTFKKWLNKYIYLNK